MNKSIWMTAVVLTALLVALVAFFIAHPRQTLMDNGGPLNDGTQTQQTNTLNVNQTAPVLSGITGVVFPQNAMVGTGFQNLNQRIAEIRTKYANKIPTASDATWHGTVFPFSLYKIDNGKVIFIGSTSDYGCEVPVRSSSDVVLPLVITPMIDNGGLECPLSVDTKNGANQCDHEAGYLIEGDTLFLTCSNVGTIDASKFHFLTQYMQQAGQTFFDGKNLGVAGKMFSGVLDPQTLAPVMFDGMKDQETGYFKDSKAVYVMSDNANGFVRVSGADSATFVATDAMCERCSGPKGKDKNHIYKGAEIVR